MRVVPVSHDELAPIRTALHVDRLDYTASEAVLRDNTFGILDGDGDLEEKRARLLALLPMAFTVMDEARATIARLRSENEALRHP